MEFRALLAFILIAVVSAAVLLIDALIDRLRKRREAMDIAARNEKLRKWGMTPWKPAAEREPPKPHPLHIPRPMRDWKNR